jgi:hypothetical protein
MTSTDEDDISSQQPLILTIGTQTDIEWIQMSKPMLMSSNNLHFHTEPVHDLVEFQVHKSSSSFENKQEQNINISPSSQKVTSRTELMSTSGKNKK